MRPEGEARSGPGGVSARQRAWLGHVGWSSGAGDPAAGPRGRVTGELPVPASEVFDGTEALGKMAMEPMLAGVSTCRYPVALEPVGQQVSEESTSTSDTFGDEVRHRAQPSWPRTAPAGYSALCTLT